MSSAQEDLVVKQEASLKRRDVVEELKELLGTLPKSLEEFERAEELIREGVFKPGRRMLQEWGERAEVGRQRPGCQKCEQEMRHKGYVECTLLTTLGHAAFCKAKLLIAWMPLLAASLATVTNPTNLHWTWRLAKVISRLRARSCPLNNRSKISTKTTGCESASKRGRGRLPRG